MTTHWNFDRFLDAQADTYSQAVQELKQGKKRTHWMWFIFPQLFGLGHSETSKYFSLRSLSEAQAYLNHPILGQRLLKVCQILLDLDTRSAVQIFGSPDNMKLKSSMTLFSELKSSKQFDEILSKYFNGEKDAATLRLLEKTK